jgi:Protein of unknown function (DUF3592)
LNKKEFEKLVASKPIMGDQTRRAVKYLLVVGAVECFLLWAVWNTAFLAAAAWHVHANGWTQTNGKVTSRSTTKYPEIFFEFVNRDGETRTLAQPIGSDGGPNEQYWSGYRPGDTVPVYVSKSLPSFARLDTTFGANFDDSLWYGFRALFFFALAALVGWFAFETYKMPSDTS